MAKANRYCKCQWFVIVLPEHRDYGRVDDSRERNLWGKKKNVPGKLEPKATATGSVYAYIVVTPWTCSPCTISPVKPREAAACR